MTLGFSRPKAEFMIATGHDGAVTAVVHMNVGCSHTTTTSACSEELARRTAMPGRCLIIRTYCSILSHSHLQTLCPTHFNHVEQQFSSQLAHSMNRWRHDDSCLVLVMPSRRRTLHRKFSN